MPELDCHLCRSSRVEAVADYARLWRVTSDCKPWPRGGQLGACRQCGTIQKALGPDWWADADRIYREYTIYHQSDGAEQAVFAEASGEPASRSSRLLERLEREVAIPDDGCLLDIGCGNGALLRAFSGIRPRWRMAGSELSAKYRAVVEQIHGVTAFYTCAPDEILESFDIITLIHALEHIHRPVDLLRRLHRKLAPGGRLVVEVPDVSQNPFDLLVADHATHFTKATAAQALRLAGFEVEHAGTDWVPKELTLVASSASAPPSVALPASDEGLDRVRSRVAWLHRVVAQARSAAAAAGDERRFGMFGTSITATWLVSELDNRVGFFVDEDPNRVGRTFMGKPILHPDDVTGNPEVFLALPPALAHHVRSRLESRNVRFTCHVPLAA